MATLSNNSSGNFTAAGTWSLIDATSLLNSETNSTATTAAFVSSSSFVPGAITIDGIAVKLLSRSAAPTGTFSWRLFDVTTASAVAGTTTTINVTDIPSVNGSTNVGWVFGKFAAPVLLSGTDSYAVQVTSSTAGQVTVYRNATAGNWSRFLRTTTTQAPAAADELYVCGEFTGAAANSTFTVTMNSTSAATVYGAIQISTKGILDYGTSAATNYNLKIAGNMSIYTDGKLQIGTSGTPIPSTSTAILQFSNSVNVDFGTEARVGSTFTTFGNAITNSALLAADAAAAATSLTTNVSTGWKSGDVIALASTTRTRTEAESKALTADAVGTTLTITALTNAHSGTSPTQAELINLTRNVQIFGTSTALQTYINIASTSIVSLNNTEFYNMGSATANKRGIDVGTTTGSCTIDGCSMHDFTVTSSLGIFANAAAGNNYTFSNCVLYAIASNGVTISATTGTSYTLNNIIVIAAGQAAAATGFSISDLTGTFTNLTGTSCQGSGMSLADNNATATEVFGTINGLIGHSNSTSGIILANITGVTNNPMGTFSNLTSWRNNTIGINASNSFTIIIDTVTVFGNTSANITIGATECDQLYFKTVTSNAGTTLTCPIGVNITSDCHEIYFDNSTFGSTTTHSTGDVNISSTNFFPRLIFRNCTLSSATPVATPGNMTEGGFVRLAKFQQTAGNHKTFFKYGTVTSDTTIYNSGPVSTRLTPNNSAATNKLQSAVKKIAVPSGQTATIKLFLRKSVAGDGSAYNGNQPRLMLKADAAAGVSSDTVLATADNTYDGVFKALTATTPAITDNAVFQVYIDCDGTVGWINTDDWSVS